mgnify:FL=1
MHIASYVPYKHVMDLHAPDFTDHICLVCQRPCASRRSLGNHLARSHVDVPSIYAYVIKFFCPDGMPPLCACGCGEHVEWHVTHYAFNRYVNGHNAGNAGFCAPSYRPTQEQVGRRNDAIRRAYANRPDIREKIGTAVLKRHAEDPAYSAKLTSALNRRWSDPKNREQQSLAQKRDWAENYDARYAKVFTEEFGRKISAANERRGTCRTSKVELELVEKLRSLLPPDDVEPSKWFNFDERRICADAWSRSLGVIFELDGHYWHGLDRRSNFTHDQMHNMAADLRKDLLLAARGATVYRFDEADPSWRSASTLEQLLDAARHRMVNGVVEKDGLFLLDGDDHPVLTRDALLRLPRDKREELLDPLVDLIGAYVERRGFFYPTCNDQLQDVLTAISTGGQTAGSAFLQSRFRSFWHVQGGPVATCLDDAKLRQVLAYRIGLNDSKPYTYELDGKIVTSNEVFDITPKQVRRGCIVQRKSVSWFRPRWAADVWGALLADAGPDRHVVWDPSAGFGARMLGFAAVRRDGCYLANEPATMTYADCCVLRDELQAHLHDFNGMIAKRGSELDSVHGQDSCDAVFTSPPFFDRERYFDEPGQCWRDHPTLEAWVSDYAAPTLLNVERTLRPGGRFALHLPADLVELFIGLADALCVGLQRTPELDSSISLRADHFARKHGHTSARAETFVTWRKVR